MNKYLEQFSEEVLKFMIESDHAQTGDVAALARIALAAKQAKPEYHIVRLELSDAWGSETVLNAYESQHDASKCKDDHGGVIIPCYTTPQPAHTEVVSPAIPDGWIKCSERTPVDARDVTVLSKEHGVVNGYYWSGTNSVNDAEPSWIISCGTHEGEVDDVTHWIPLPAAPKPESEL